MQLIGQFDSPFVRRVGIALTLYGMAFVHRPWSVFGDADKIGRYNPLLRVPTLVLDDGTALLESSAILDYLDGQAGAAALLPAAEPARHRALRRIALATGMADKAVSLFYELRLHDQRSELWVDRCRAQIAATLAVLEAECAARPGPWWHGAAPGHDDIALGAAIAFITEAHPGLIDLTTCPAIAAHCAAFDALPVARAIYQRFNPPA